MFYYFIIYGKKLESSRTLRGAAAQAAVLPALAVSARSLMAFGMCMRISAASRATAEAPGGAPALPAATALLPAVAVAVAGWAAFTARAFAARTGSVLGWFAAVATAAAVGAAARCAAAAGRCNLLAAALPALAAPAPAALAALPAPAG